MSQLQESEDGAFQQRINKVAAPWDPISELCLFPYLVSKFQLPAPLLTGFGD